VGRKRLPVVQAQFDFLVVFRQHRKGIAEHVGPQNLHGAFVRLVFLAEARAHAVKMVVVVLFVRKAAEQTAANARNFGRIQKEVLLFCHADGHGRKFAQIPAAAADHAAVAHSAHHLRFVAHANLAQLDTRAVFAHKVFDQIAKINAGRRGEVKDELAAVKKNLHIHKLHIKVAVADALAAELLRFTRHLLVGFATVDVF